MGSQKSDMTEQLNWTEPKSTNYTSQTILPTCINTLSVFFWIRVFSGYMLRSGAQAHLISLNLLYISQPWAYLTIHEPILFRFWLQYSSVQSLSHVWLCDPMDCSTSGFPVQHQLLEFTQTHVHRVNDAIQPPHPLLSPSPAFNLSQHQGPFKWVSSSRQVAKVLEFQPQHQSFQWIFRTNFI